MNQSSKQNRRLDIQGLRAVALLLVIAYHADLHPHGGFVGVDVFFVLSGFVVTQMVVREHESTREFAWGRFLGNRLHRLMPATVAVTAITTVCFLALLSPFGELQSLFTASLSSALFFGNVHFSRQNPYFQMGESPLLHLWSLGVEAQFYLAMAIIVLVALRIEQRLKIRLRTSLSLSMLSISIFSLLVTEILLSTEGSSYRSIIQIPPELMSFYWMPPRLWEFGIGALVALTPANRMKIFSKFANVLCWFGLGLVLLSAFSLDKASRFPGISALPAVVGTALILTTGNSATTVSKVLKSKIFVWIGDISFSWYLWHWPFIVATKVLITDSSAVLLLAAIVALIPSAISNKFVEIPVRDFAKKSPLISVAMAISYVVLTISITETTKFAAEVVKNELVSFPDAWEDKRASMLAGCYNLPSGIQVSEACTWGRSTAKSDVFLVGDSHAASASDGLIAATSTLNLTLSVASFGGCPFLSPSNSITCDQTVDTTKKLILESGAKTVVIVNSGLYYLKSGNSIPDSNGETSRQSPGQIRNYTQALVNSVVELRNLQLEVIVLMEVPEMRFSERVSLVSPNPKPQTTSLQEQRLRQELQEQIIKRLKFADGVTLIETDQLFCPANKCSPIQNGEWLYMDSTHLNPNGSRKLTQYLIEALKF